MRSTGAQQDVRRQNEAAWRSWRRAHTDQGGRRSRNERSLDNGYWRLPRSLADVEYQLRALWGLVDLSTSTRVNIAALCHWRSGSAALAAERHDRNDRLIGERMIAASQYFLGDLRSARHHLERFADGIRKLPVIVHTSFAFSSTRACRCASFWHGSCGFRAFLIRDAMRRKPASRRHVQPITPAPYVMLSPWGQARLRS